MNWPRAKTILIISFLLLDLYLAWHLFWLPRDQQAYTLTEAELTELRNIAQHFGVELVATPEPLKVAASPALMITQVSLDETAAWDLARPWLGNAADADVTIRQQGATWEFQVGSQLVTVGTDEYFAYHEVSWQDESLTPAQQTADQVAAVAAARAFLAVHLGEQAAEAYQPVLVLEDEASQCYLVELVRMVQDLPVFVDAYRCWVNNQQVLRLVGRQAELNSVSEEALAVVGADLAVKRYLAGLSEPLDQPVSILDLRLGYGLVPAKPGQLQPVWRFYTNDPSAPEFTLPAGQWSWEAESR
ncbi:MAG: hypothetical protein ACOX18_10640 [Bacillota bacterium]